MTIPVYQERRRGKSLEEKEIYKLIDEAWERCASHYRESLSFWKTVAALAISALTSLIVSIVAILILTKI